MWATSHCHEYCLRRMLLSIVKVSFHSEWLINCAYYRYMSRPVMSGPGLYDPTTIMNADILAYCQKEGWCKLAFYLLAFFLLPIWHDLCFWWALRTMLRRIGPVKCMQKATNEWILSSKILFPRVAYGIWLVTLKNDSLVFKCFHIFLLLERLFSYVILG